MTTTMRTTLLTPTVRLQQNPDILAAPMGEETVMMSMSRNNYYGLDEVGSRVWALLAQPQTLTDLCTALQQEFAVDDETCQREVTTLVQALVAADLVNVG
ncbi:MAG: PqqD family peptide modification chaperone [Caldilineaceae bacterium]|jgi:hypothetical protein